METQLELFKVRSSSKYRKWRRSVLKRDGRKCTICGSDKRIEVDHIKSFRWHPLLRFKTSNGRVICNPCHRKTDGYGIKNNKPKYEK